MTAASNIGTATETLKWLKSPSTIEKNIIGEIGYLDSSKIVFDFSKYNFASKIHLSKVSKGIHSKVFNDFLMSHIKAGRYPILIKDVLAGKESTTERVIHDIAMKVVADPKLLKDFVAYALVKELEAANEIAESESLDQSRAERLEAMVYCFDALYKKIFDRANHQIKEVLAQAIQTDSDIINLVNMHPKKNGLNAAHVIFGMAALFITLYSTAFFFIDSNASILGLEKFFGLK